MAIYSPINIVEYNQISVEFSGCSNPNKFEMGDSVIYIILMLSISIINISIRFLDPKPFIVATEHILRSPFICYAANLR